MPKELNLKDLDGKNVMYDVFNFNWKLTISM